MKNKFFLFLITLTMLSTLSYAYNKSHSKRLRMKKECPYCDLIEVSLQKRDLKGANLENADLASANFSSSNMEYAIFHKAYLNPLSRGLNLTF